MRQPYVSICMPAYQAERTIRDAIDSVLWQTYQDVELIVVDDCSTDRTAEIVASYRHPTISLIRNDVNLGGGPNYTTCMHLGRGKYTAIYHADDIYDPRIVEKQVAFLDAHADAGAVFTLADCIDEEGRIIRKAPAHREMMNMLPPDRTYGLQEVFRLLLRHHNFIHSPSVMARSEVLVNDIVHFDDKRYGASGDLDMWLRLLEKHRIGILPCPLMGWRQAGTQWSSRDRKQYRMREPFLDVIDDLLKKKTALGPLDIRDYMNLEVLQMVDRYKRASDSLSFGDTQYAAQLTRGALNWALLWNVLNCRPIGKPNRFVKWWAAGVILRIVSLCCSSRLAKLVVDGGVRCLSLTRRLVGPRGGRVYYREVLQLRETAIGLD